MKSFRYTLALGGVLIALILWFTLYEKNYKLTRQEAQEEVKRFISMDRKDIQELVIERSVGGEDEKAKERDKNKDLKLANQKPAKVEPLHTETYEFKKTGDDWYLVTPLNDLADASMVASAISSLVQAKHDRELDPGADLSIYGLDKPKMRLKIRKDSNAPFEELIIGSDTPVGYDLYVMTAKDKKVYLTSRSIKSSFDRPLKDFRNKKLLSMASNEIPQLEVTVGKDTFMLKKDDTGDTWKLPRENLPASKTEVQKTLSSLVGLRAKDYVEEKGQNLERFGLSKPDVKFVVTEKGKKETTEIIVGKTKDKAYAKRGDKGTVYEVDLSALPTLSRASTAYHDLNLADFNRFNVASLKIQRGKNVLELQKKGEEWLIPSEPEVKLDPSKVEGLVAKIQDTRIVKYADPKEATGLKTPQLAFLLADKDGKTLASIKFGSQSGARFYGEREGLDRPFLVAEKDYKSLDLEKSAFIKQIEKKTETGQTDKKKS